MPTYLFQNPKTEEVIEVFQRAKDQHKYVDENGLEWQRVWTIPNASVDSQCDGSYESFMRNTQNMKGVTVGDMWDASKEASLKREKQLGKDPVKENWKKNYSKGRKGMKHSSDSSGSDSSITL